MATKKYRCKVCGYIHEGDQAPEQCPVCKAPASEFELVEADGAPAEKKKGINKNGNAYILTYTTVIVVVVALLLSITSGALRERQNANVELDKKKQILSSLPAVVLEDADAAKIYAETIRHIYVLDAEGNIKQDLDPVKDFNYSAGEGELLIYAAGTDQDTKWIIPMNGKGLWGAIWGYIALENDRNTVHGVYFSHAGETPGLGSNIVEIPFRSQFEGKHLMQNGSFASIAVMKIGQTAAGQDQVDALSGGTITSKGVETMLRTSIAPYEPFLKKAETNANNNQTETAEQTVAEEGGTTL